MKFMLSLITLLSVGPTVAMAGAEASFCVAREEIIPYSPFSRFSADCNGKKLEVTALFGHKLEENFKLKLKENGFKIIFKFNNSIVFSKTSRAELNVNELCLITKSTYNNLHSVICEDGTDLTLDYSPNAVAHFIKSYNYNILQKPQGKSSFYVISR